MKERIVAAMPMISLLLFLTSGFVFEKWLLGLTFFLLIPLSTVLFSSNILKRLNQMMPLITVVIFLWIAFGLNQPHPGWVIFFLIPLSDTLIGGRINARKLITFIITVSYILLGIFIDDFWHPGWLMFLLIPILNTLLFPQKTMRFVHKGRQAFSKTFDFQDDDDIDIH